MVDVTDKEVTVRRAVASSCIWMEASTLERIKGGGIKKGDVLQVARLAGIMAAKKTPDLIPLCHPITIDAVNVDFSIDEGDKRIDIEATTKTASRTGVEMEALTAATVAALTIYDMCKAIDRSMIIGDTKLLRKEGGRSGTWIRPE